MDGFNSREFYGYSLSEDPKLRTTTRNYEFKYNSTDHLEKIINRVKMDREKKKQSARHTNWLQNKEPSQDLTPPMVGTQIGRSYSREAVVKIMSDEEIEAMISQALHSPNNLPPITESVNSKYISHAKYEDRYEIENPQKHRRKLSQQLSVEVLPMPQPQWVEIKPAQKSIASIFEVPVECSAEYSTDSDEDLSAFDLAHQTLKNEELQIEDQTKNENYNFDSISFDSRMTDDFDTRNQESAHQNEDESPPGSPVSLGIDSPLNDDEHSEMERVLGKVLPHVPPMKFDNLESQEEMSGLSEYSEEEEDEEDYKSQDDVSLVGEEINTQPTEKILQINRVPQPIQALSFRSTQSSQPNTPRPVQKLSKSRKPATPLSSYRNGPKTPMKTLDTQIEDLKQEKIKIFSKMTSIQEKIIKALDALRINLVEIALPDGEAEKKLRERNCLEFSVRFSRNYLFPLGKMIEELRLSPKDTYRSALTNEPCVKICGIYGLLNQAVQCYQKQLRHFFTDSVPKKLDLLLNLIKDTTNLCLEKEIFDKRDTLIQSLISRCETFLEFVMQFAENKKTAREEENALRSERRSQFKLSKTSSKWDLTMNLNKLNMYEPTLVQKKPKKSLRKKSVETVRSKATPKPKKLKKPKLIAKDSEDHIALPVDDPVETQVRKDNYGVDSVQLINDAIAQQPESDLAKTLIETLQDITKDEVHQMFGPIVSNLDSILKSSDNPQMNVESVLNDLESKIQQPKCKQLKIDEVATENTTQNNNTYQKEGTHLSKGEQQKQQQQLLFKENRKVSKAKAKATSCTSINVKEGSTEQTKRYNSRSQLMGTTSTSTASTICDKQSLSNVDVVDDADVAAFVSEKSLVKQNTRNGAGAFLSATAKTAAAAKNPKPPASSDAIEIGGTEPATPPLSTSPPIKLNESMQQPPPPQPVAYSMTSLQCFEYSDGLPAAAAGLPGARADTFAPDCHQRTIGDGEHRKKDAVSQRKVRYGAANVIDGAEDRQEICRKNLPVTSSPVRNEATKSGQMAQLKHRRNALYTFVKYLEDNLPYQNHQDEETRNFDKIPNQSISAEAQTEPRDISVEFLTEDNSNKEEVAENNKDVEFSAPIEDQKQQDIQNQTDIMALLEERKAFIERCREDPLYSNPQFLQPWKVISKISHSLAREIVESFEDDISFGEESYVRDFINMEIQT